MYESNTTRLNIFIEIRWPQTAACNGSSPPHWHSKTVRLKIHWFHRLWQTRVNSSCSLKYRNNKGVHWGQIQIHCFWWIPLFCLPPPPKKLPINVVEHFNVKFLEIFCFAANIHFNLQIFTVTVHYSSIPSANLVTTTLFYSVKEKVETYSYISIHFFLPF